MSAPCTWQEVEAGTVTPQSFTIKTMPDRMDAVGDLWADMKRGRSLGRAIERLKKLAGSSG